MRGWPSSAEVVKVIRCCGRCSRGPNTARIDVVCADDTGLLELADNCTVARLLAWPAMSMNGTIIQGPPARAGQESRLYDVDRLSVPELGLFVVAAAGGAAISATA